MDFHAGSDGRALLCVSPPRSPSSRPLLGVHLLEATADPLVFAFHRDQADAAPACIIISRHAWQLLGPSQAVDYVVERYLLEFPEERARVGPGLVRFCVRYALGLGGTTDPAPAVSEADRENHGSR